MNRPWSIATPNRPSVSPTRIVPIRTGEATIRRETPSWRVRMSCVAAVIEVRNMNRISWLWAPGWNAPVPAGKIPSPTRLDRDRHARPSAPGRERAAASAASNGTPRPAAPPGAPPATAAACSAIAAATASRSAEIAFSALAQDRHLGRRRRRAASRRSPAGMITPDLERAVLDPRARSSSAVAGSLSSRLDVPVAMASTSSAPRAPLSAATMPIRGGDPPAVHRAQHDDQDDRQQEDEEEARPVAQEPADVDQAISRAFIGRHHPAAPAAARCRP